MTPRRALAAVGALAVVVGAALTSTTTAAYHDTVAAQTPEGGLRTATHAYTPQQTYLAGTATALGDDGSIAVWGYRGNGLSGTGATTVASSAPVTVLTLPHDGHPAGRRSAVRLAGVSLDNFFATDPAYTGLAALSDDGRVYTWGGNQVAHVMGRPGPWTTPGQVAIPDHVVDLVSTASVFVALTSTGDVYTWGYAQGRGVTGQGTLTASSAAPTRILTGVHSVGAGVWNAWAIRGDTVAGDATTGVQWWGWANAGTFATDPSGDRGSTSRAVPTQSVALSALTTTGCARPGVVAGSPQDTCRVRTLTGHYYGNQALLDDGTLLTWGDEGEWGTGRTGDESRPTPLVLAPGVTAVQVADTEDYVLVRGSDGSVYAYGRYAWAWGPHPTTGATSNVNLRTPTRLAALGDRVAHVAGHGYTGHALLTDGALVSWGGSDQGGSDNTHRPVRDGYATTTTGTTTSAGLTRFVMPGTGATP
ncbi:RCC1 domain-containing protein [Cellulomonas biazotea]|uniref:Chromosome condensation regulator RCC1 n=1 Tax=Cellulomonas biazotea TaxID=1709 RepID=A0A402DVH3_9CELL|nr:hypothetical protein [Cellulomonas biazotea]GCE78117.1 hypothetical protein CBZ_31730 [Cellulomonas biazotea]